MAKFENQTKIYLYDFTIEELNVLSEFYNESLTKAVNDIVREKLEMLKRV